MTSTPRSGGPAWSPGLALLALAAPLLLGFQPPTDGEPGEVPTSPATRPVQAPYDELEAEHDAAYRVWRLLPYEDRAPFDVAPFLARFHILAETGDGRAMLWVVRRHRSVEQPGFERAVVVQRYVDRLLAAHSHADWLAPLAMNHMLDETLAVSERQTNLERWLKLGTHEEADTMVRFCLGMVLASQDEEAKTERALALFDALVEEHPEDGWAQQAKGEAYKLRHLQVGMVAPDFQAEDVEGAPLRLADFRGKVTLLTFWGFW